MKRMTEILRILASHGFGHIFGKKSGKEKRGFFVPNKSLWVRIRRVLEDLGPTFVKLGQIFSNRPDVIPLELAQELAKLRDNVQSFPYAQVEKIIQEELGQPLEEIFLRLDEDPVASASIAQVHVGLLRNGQKVAVKVQRPDIEHRIQDDIEILRRLAKILEDLVLKSNVIDTHAILKEFEKSIARELDFKNESLFLRKFAANFKESADIKAPLVYDRYSSRRLLVMEYVEGTSPMDRKALLEQGIDPKKIARIGAVSFLEQIFVHGYFHGDPHPGNILVMKPGKLCYLDFGLMGVIYGRYREHLAGMLLAVASGDSRALCEHLMGLAQREGEPYPDSFEEDVFLLLETYSHLSLRDIKIAEFVNSTVNLILKFELTLPPSLYLLVKALLTTEGLARELDPNFEMLSYISPFVRKFVLEKFHPKKLGAQAFDTTLAYGKMVQEIPGNVKLLGQFLKRGKLNFVVDQENLSDILSKADKITNRISFSLIITGLIVGSSLVVQSGLPPTVWGVPLFGMLGFVGAGLMGFALLISIWRSGSF
jgi:ubiquinone biosynthesis protein